MKQCYRFLITYLIALLFCGQANAALILTFNENSAWDAEGVVIVDRQGKVLESLKGSIEPGTRLSLSALKVSTDISVNQEPFTFPQQLTNVQAEKILLLLNKNSAGAWKLLGVHYENMKPVEGDETISVAWISAGRVYASRQISDDVQNLDSSEEKAFLRRIKDIIATQNDFKTAKEKPLQKRAQSLDFLIKSHSNWYEIYPAYQEILDSLATCGPRATPVYRRLLNDDKVRWIYSRISTSFARASRNEAGILFTSVLQTELPFWRTTAPKLPVGWWNEGIGKNSTYDDLENLRARYCKLSGALSALRSLNYRPCQDVVTELRTFWRSLPQLEDREGLNQISQICDVILHQLSPTIRHGVVRTVN